MIPFARRSPLVVLAVAAVCSGCWGSGTSPKPTDLESPVQSRPDVSGLHTGPELYRALCAACHGEQGAADGPGAQSLYPPARNLLVDRFRLVSTNNLVPAPDDIDRVIAQGMLGTSMRAFDELSAAQRQVLVDEVLRLRRAGEEDLAGKVLRSLGEPVDDARVQDLVRLRSTPGDLATVPPLDRGNRPSIERGKAIYFRQNCQACHGSDGTGAADMRLVTDEGAPTRGRDLVFEPFKGGNTRQSVYLRLALGMPGTPMPASRSLSPQELADLTEFCLSLSREPKRILTNHQRRQLATGKAYLEAPP